MAEFGDATAIRRRWTETPTACSHERTEKEYYLGMQTGDVVCMDCGITWWWNKPPPSAAGINE